MSTTLSPEAFDVLARSTCEANAVHLPAGQLDRRLYVEVDDALKRLGGKWNRKASAHVFAADPAPKLTALLAAGGVKPKRNPDAFFPTPRAVMWQMLELAHEMSEGGCDSPYILEPSAGAGAIAAAVTKLYSICTVHCVEMDEERARALREAGMSHVWNADFLDWQTPLDLGYSLVLMNPPFAVERDPAEWIEHVRRAHGMLAQNGVLVAVVPSSYETRTDRKHVRFREWAESHGARTVAVEPGAFKESGTGVNTVLLGLRSAQRVEVPA